MIDAIFAAAKLLFISGKNKFILAYFSMVYNKSEAFGAKKHIKEIDGYRQGKEMRVIGSFLSLAMV